MELDSPEKPPRNRDLDVPKRQGDEPSPMSEEGGPDRDRNGPVPEEETYERDPRNQRPR
jgi:hypothetical protein